MSQPSLPPPRPLFGRRGWRPSAPQVALLIFLVMFIFASFNNGAIFNSIANMIVNSVTPHTSTGVTANIANPKTGTTSGTHLPPPVKTKPFTPAKTQQTINRTYTPAMKPMILALDPAKGAHAISSDGTLEVTIPAGAITVADVANMAHAITTTTTDGMTKATVSSGAITAADVANMAYAKNAVPSKQLSLRVTQIAPGSGSNTGGGVVSFGTYKFEIIDGTGNVVGHGLHQPTHVQFHLGIKPTAYDVSKAFATINGAVPSGTQTAGGTTQLPVHFDQKHNILATDLPADTQCTSGGLHISAYEWWDADICAYGTDCAYCTSISGNGRFV